MQKRKLRDLEVSSIGLGCMGMSHGYGPVADENEMIKLIHRAIDLGVTFFDTAETYGEGGNESLVGKALKNYKEKVIIATKFGIVSKDNGILATDSRPETIRKSLDGSLKRLGLDCIDLYYQHRVDPKVPLEDVAGTIQELINEGKIKHWGMSEATPEQLRYANSICPVTAIQSRYSIMARDYERTIFPVCEELGIGFVAFSPLANGFLSGAYNKDSKFDNQGDMRAKMPQFQYEIMEAQQNLLDLLEKFAKEKNATKAQISLAWMLAKKPFIVPIPGTRKIERLVENSTASDVELTPQELAKLNEALSHIEIKGVYLGAKTK